MARSTKAHIVRPVSVPAAAASPVRVLAADSAIGRAALERAIKKGGPAFRIAGHKETLAKLK